MLDRRDLLKLGLLGSAAWTLSGHAPYRQWQVYRAERLMIVACRRDAEAFPLAERLAADLERSIPDAKPEAARAPTLLHMTRLLLTRQIEVGLLTAGQARDMAQGAGEGASEGPVSLSLLAILREPFVLVCHSEFDRDRAYLLTFGLHDNNGSGALSASTRGMFQVLRRAGELGIPLHPGAQEFYVEQQAGEART
jgi:TRAP-type uncharacterized transport system substrate-binding protein